ncbi:MAG: LPS export ABC transporter periplasmic protein LptC [Pseudomonadales bacterium]|uniref:Lipopolysaccharide export system protein LptC n=1 Tax=Halopseudomonas aestusnigri TaxID=857252 RepID=A0AAQ1G3X3_9GAMM|nr:MULTISPECIES: LPS export ABC transporter periplasmic protein LptC [Halopseudomonas]MAD27702.1 LPS export ABC transporter periplasmic protein LptC [Pseudomonadales bacterium]MEE2798425.1 LPS export ABC transporter periplasmic protein LptC [Pseudomonadota bacterium]HBT57306.1 LPS export ABC transporter periplasmic protein LptC [Pseudomonas sp.]MAH00239.1 LPS export ABC transporter periplasmic protein LptC [Pseudomonadales bacterium]MAK72994.1 LPS export ABC transporter periplasmic protein Lpt
MNLTLPRYLVVGLLIIAGAALAMAVGYWNINPSSFNTGKPQTQTDRPDFYIDNARILMLNEQGKVAYRLTTSHAVHQVDDGSTHLEDPELLFYRGEDPTPWLLKSRQGVVTQRGDRVDLTTDVLLKQNTDDARQLTTSALTLFPARDYAETDQPVRIEAARSVTTAEGMQLFLNDGSLKLLSTVRGQYEVR